MMFELEENHLCKYLFSGFINEESKDQITWSRSHRESELTWRTEPSSLNFQPSLPPAAIIITENNSLGYQAFR